MSGTVYSKILTQQENLELVIPEDFYPKVEVLNEHFEGFALQGISQFINHKIYKYRFKEMKETLARLFIEPYKLEQIWEKQSSSIIKSRKVVRELNTSEGTFKKILGPWRYELATKNFFKHFEEINPTMQYWSYEDIINGGDLWDEYLQEQDLRRIYV